MRQTQHVQVWCKSLTLLVKYKLAGSVQGPRSLIMMIVSLSGQRQHSRKTEQKNHICILGKKEDICIFVGNCRVIQSFSRCEIWGRGCDRDGASPRGDIRGTSVNLNLGKYESIVARDDLPLLLGFDLLPSFYRPRNYCVRTN